MLCPPRVIGLDCSSNLAKQDSQFARFRPQEVTSGRSTPCKIHSQSEYFKAARSSFIEILGCHRTAWSL
eukprot:929965-Rhodomonas_salina.1